VNRLIRTSRSVFLRTLTWLSLVLFVVLGTISYANLNQKHVQAATNNTINFQARILTAAGNLVPDGSYNVEFKIYDDSSGGTNLWTESWTGASKITTKNGYVTASLGSVHAFDNHIPNWGQQLYLTLNIGGTGAPSWDGEMNPRMQITAVPYAMSSSKLAVDNGTYNTSLTFTDPTVGNQSFSLPDLAAATSATIITTGNLASITGVGTLTSGSWHSTTIDVDHGGTGAATFTQYGVLYGNGTSAIGVTTVGSTGQCLVSGNGTVAPSWGDCASGTTGSYIQNQNAGQQATSNFWISGTGRADTSFTTPLLVGTATANSVLAIQGNTATTGNISTNANIQFKVDDSGATTAMTILNNGKVGIGTATPTGRLHVTRVATEVSISVYGGYFENLALNSTTDGINKYGLYVNSSGNFAGGGGAATNNYGLYIATPSGAVNNYSIYSAGGLNYLAGNLGLGVAPSATANLVVAAPTTGVASLRLTASSAVDVSAPVIGDMWFNGTNLNFRKDGTTTVDLLAGSTGAYILNQTSLQASSNFHISGTGTADTSFSTPLLFNSTTADNILTLQGNSAAAGNTATNANIQIKVGNSGGTTAMTILNNGYVGVGTTAPDNKMTIQGTGTAGSGVNDVLRISGGELTDENDATGLLFVQRGSNDLYGAYIRLVNTDTMPDYLEPRLDFGVQDYGTSALGSVTTKMSITGDGYVGIGTTNPSGRLHSYISNSAATSTTYSGRFENLATNTTVDSMNKYGLYVNSSGSFAGSTGTYTNNYGLYLADTTGADNNYSIYSAGGLNYLAGNLSVGTTTATSNLNVGSTTLTGTLVDLQVSGIAAAAAQKALNILTTGANGTGGITTYGGYISNTHSGGTSTNVALYLNASGGTTANYGLIVNSGYVGIGTTSPAANLHVYSATSTGTYSDNNVESIIEGTDGRLQIKSTEDGSSYGSGVIMSTGARSWAMMSQGSGDGYKFHIGYRQSAGTEDIMSASTKLLTIDTTGNVGVGATSPTGKLHVYTDNTAVTTANYNGYFENLATNTTTDAINKYGLYVTSTGSFTGSGGAATNNYGLYVATPTGGDNNYAAIFQGGNVGIGNTAPTGGRLVVQGSTADNTANALFVTDSGGTSNLFTVRNDGNIGIGTAPDDANKLYIRKTFDATTTQYGILSRTDFTPTVNGAANSYGIYSWAVKNGTYNTGIVQATTSKVSLDGSGTTSALRGVNSFISLESGSAGTVSVLADYVASSPIIAGSTTSVTNAYGLLVNNMGSARVTNAYGIYVDTQSSATALNYAIYSQGGTNYFGGTINQQNTSSTAMTIQSAAAADTMFTVDTSTGNKIKIGNNTGTGTATTILVLDSATTSTGITAVNGAMYYDTTANRIQCYENGAWGICGKNSLQESYNYSVGGTTPEIKLDSTRNALDIQDADTPLGATVALFAVRGSNAGTIGASLFQVSNNADSPLVGIGLGAVNPVTGIDLQFGGNANRTIQVLQNTTAGAGRTLTMKGGQALTAGAGGQLNLYGGDAVGGNNYAGNVYLTGGTGTGTYANTKGLVVIDTPTYTTAARQDCGTTPCAITQANVDSTGAVIINATAASLTVTLPDPLNTTAGRIVYVTAYGGSNDFSLSVNGGGTGNLISMRQNTTATMIWNGTDWTAAGASSSTTLQAAYDNTLTSAGGAEIVLNNSASSNGLTVRNSSTSPIIGGALLEIQSSIGSNLLSVNNNATEYSSNGGAETMGGSSTTFPATTWAAAPAGGTVSRHITQGNYIATGAASVSVITTTTSHGAANTLASALTPNLKYTVSYAVRGTTSFATLDTVYSRDGTNTSTTSCDTAHTVTTGLWTRVSCTFIAPSSGITAANAIFIRQSDATGRTYYIDNLSVTIGADISHATDGSVDDAGNFATNWTAFGTGSTANRETSIIYDTSASARADTTNSTDRGIRNNMSITPQVSTQYLVTLYARANGSLNDLTVRYSRDGGVASFVSCTDYNTQVLSTVSWTKITCLFTTDGTIATNPDLVITQAAAPGGTRSIYIDALSITLNSNTASNVQIGGGNEGGPATLFTLDRSSGAPIAANNDSYLGSMYYDTSTGKIQCYESDGWGACGSAPDNIVNLNPEFSGAVLNGGTSPGVGTMTADFCGSGGGLAVNDGSGGQPNLCASGEARNFYKWTSPQASQQTYSIYVTYQLPASFKAFADDNTVQLTARRDTSNGVVSYEMFRSEGGSITQCGSGETTVTSSDNTWQTIGINGNESTGCGFSTSSANAFVIFKINVKAQSNANAYVGTLSFTTTGR